MHAEDASHMRRVVLSDQAIQIDPPSPSTAGSSTIGIARIMNGTFALNASRNTFAGRLFQCPPRITPPVTSPPALRWRGDSTAGRGS